LPSTLRCMPHQRSSTCLPCYAKTVRMFKRTHTVCCLAAPDCPSVGCGLVLLDGWFVSHYLWYVCCLQFWFLHAFTQTCITYSLNILRTLSRWDCWTLVARPDIQLYCSGVTGGLLFALDYSLLPCLLPALVLVLTWLTTVRMDLPCLAGFPVFCCMQTQVHTHYGSALYAHSAMQGFPAAGTLPFTAQVLVLHTTPFGWCSLLVLGRSLG